MSDENLDSAIESFAEQKLNSAGIDRFQCKIDDPGLQIEIAPTKDFN